MNQEPITLMTIASAIIGLAVSFGLNLSAEQTGAIVLVVFCLSNVIARNFTWSQRSVELVTNMAAPRAEQVLERKQDDGIEP